MVSESLALLVPLNITSLLNVLILSYLYTQECNVTKSFCGDILRSFH